MASFFFLFLIFAICLARGFSDDSFVEDTATTKLAKEEQQLISSPFVELFGKTLYRWKNNMIPDKDGNVEIEEISTAQLLSGKVAVAVYFSASWCGPCRQFTPALAKMYKSLNDKGKKFEVVWISRDRSADEFVGYYQKMPWLAVTLENVNGVLEKLAPKFGLKGIPHLVILDGDDASVITLDGRMAVAKDPYGLEYPWRPRTLMSLIPKPIQRIVKAQLESALKALKNYLRGVLESLAPAKFVDLILGKADDRTNANVRPQQRAGGGEAEAQARAAAAQRQQAEAQARAYAAAQAERQATAEAQAAYAQQAQVEMQPKAEAQVEYETEADAVTYAQPSSAHSGSYSPDQREADLLAEAEQYGDLALSV